MNNEFTKEQVDAIKAGINQPFWAALRQVIQANLDDMLEKILTDTSLREPIPGMTHRELLIDWYDMNKRLLDLPEKIVKSIEEGKSDPVDFDPYPKVEDQIING